jgi:hypothetical protein
MLGTHSLIYLLCFNRVTTLERYRNDRMPTKINRGLLLCDTESIATNNRSHPGAVEDSKINVDLARIYLSAVE